MRIRSFAKINLGLEVIGKRADGYHEIRTLLQSIDLHDEMKFRALPEARIELSGTDPNLSWGKNNLIHQAATLLAQRHAPRKGIAVHVIKRIPVGKGLGGGSSNAAMTLWALNQLWDLGLDGGTLKELGAALGSDVPYFFEGGLCLGTGRGEVVKPLPDLPSRACLLLFPHLSVSTEHIYRHHRVSLTSHGKGSRIMQFLERSNLDGLANELEATVFRFYPLIKENKRRLHDWQPEMAAVSGSGSAVFGIFRNKGHARRAQRTLQAECRVQLVETLSRDRYRKSIRAGV
jgi:4-diphosphocytidyl-2-C-methyl-D-erythritol kinase